MSRRVAMDEMRGALLAAAALLSSLRPEPPRAAKPGATRVRHGFTVNLGNNQRKREIPHKRKHRVRLRAFLQGRLHGRPLTAHERSWL